MKVRNGFVSNSSSSSFIISGDNIKKAQELIDAKGGYDYYELDGKLYTSFISDCDDFYNKMSELTDETIEGSHGSPYDEDAFVELEGDRGFGCVYIKKDVILGSEKTKLYNELFTLDNPEVHAILKKYKRVWEYEIEKWLCK